MKVFFLGPYNKSQQNIINFLKSDNNIIEQTENILDLRNEVINETDFLISYGYRFKISNDILSNFKDRAINLHISLLPWNKGSHPNFWSFAEETPHGVSIHKINEKIDDGSILCQQDVNHNDESNTLRESHESLLINIENLFFDNWFSIKKMEKKELIINEKGSFHKKNDIHKYQKYLINGWDTKVKLIKGIAKR